MTEKRLNKNQKLKLLSLIFICCIINTCCLSQVKGTVKYINSTADTLTIPFANIRIIDSQNNDTSNIISNKNGDFFIKSGFFSKNENFRIEVISKGFRKTMFASLDSENFPNLFLLGEFNPAFGKCDKVFTTIPKDKQLLKCMRYLDLSGKIINKVPKRMNSLKRLTLVNCRIKIEVTKLIKKMKSIELIDFRGANVTIEDIEEIKERLPNTLIIH